MSYQGTINGRMSRHGNYLGSPSRAIEPKPAAPAYKPVRPCTAHDQLAGGQCGNCLRRH